MGNGASAVVFAAEKDGREAAVKVFDRELVERVGEETQLARINMELKLVGTCFMIRHPRATEKASGRSRWSNSLRWVGVQLPPFF